MSVVKKEFTYPSVQKGLNIHAISWKPEDGEIKGVLQLVHGMAEYIDRYDGFARFFAEKGFAVYGNDHIGHGKSVNEEYPLGYFGENENGHVFVEDVKTLTDIAREENPGKKLVLFGHSMGSFVARVYIGRFGDGIDGAIICGTAGPNPAIGVALALTKMLNGTSPKKGGKFLNGVAFGTYNNKTDKRTAFDWLSYDEGNVDRYIADPGCGFLFSNNGFRALITLNNHINSKEVYEGTPKDLPIFFVAGKGDPVGEYTKGVDKVVAKMKKTGHTNVSNKYYESRHEIHNEADPVPFFEDMIDWMDKNVL